MGAVDGGGGGGVTLRVGQDQVGGLREAAGVVLGRLQRPVVHDTLRHINGGPARLLYAYIMTQSVSHVSY